MNRKVFFDYVRQNLFNGSMSQSQVDGINEVLDYREEKWATMPDAELAYLLATDKWETAHTMQPIKEMGSESYLKSKKYYPWYGRGLVQITWKANYDKFGIANPDDALKWPTALDVIFRGMIFGMFTGRKLADYISPERVDYVGARAIINGTDKAVDIARIADVFRKALLLAQNAEPSVPPPPPLPPDVDPTAPPTQAPAALTQEAFEEMLIVALGRKEVQDAVAKIIAERLQAN